MKNVLLIGGFVVLVVLGLQAGAASAGTQDFTLVNQTGSAIHNLYVSETSKDDWEEDVLGDDVLEDGQSVNVTFSGKKACTWDLMIKDENGEGLYWRKINLCEVSKVVLHCNKKECTATFE
jgi:hypothetical protein